jgi:eukaryotic-like serine/threonine-protein kinase
MLPLEPGAIFARDFKIVRPLARGGMGSVYEVEQVSTSKTRALKILHAQLAGDPKIRQRFEQEARVAARIESDHIVDVVAAGIEEPGTPWLVMEFLKGTDLAAHLDRHGPRPIGEVLEIFRQVGHGLGAAHRAGLVHRDLKPENIFLAESRREGAPFTVKVLDFGIAKAIESAPGRATQAMGTPYWMAPEQCEDSKLIAPATDVWALGLIAYALLTGACYWRSARKEDSGVANLLMEMTSLPLDPPSARAREYGRDHLLPPNFDAWFARCVTRPIDQRYRDASECVAALVQRVSAAPMSLPVAPTLTPAQSAAFGAPVASAPPSAPVVAPVSAPMVAPVSVPMAAPMSMPASPGAPPHASIQQAWAPTGVPAPIAPTHVSASRPPWVLLAVVLVVAGACVGAIFAVRVMRHDAHVMVDELPQARPNASTVATPMMAPMAAPPTPMLEPVPPLAPAPMPAEHGIPRPARPTDDRPRTMLIGVSPMSNSAATLTRAGQITHALRGRTPAVDRCVRITLAQESGDFHGSFAVVIEVANEGGFVGSHVQEIDSHTFDMCVRDALRTTAFPHDAGGEYKLAYHVR